MANEIYIGPIVLVGPVARANRATKATPRSSSVGIAIHPAALSSDGVTPFTVESFVRETFRALPPGLKFLRDHIIPAKDGKGISFTPVTNPKEATKVPQWFWNAVAASSTPPVDGKPAWVVTSGLQNEGDNLSPDLGPHPDPGQVPGHFSDTNPQKWIPANNVLKAKGVTFPSEELAHDVQKNSGLKVEGSTVRGRQGLIVVGTRRAKGDPRSPADLAITIWHELDHAGALRILGTPEKNRPVHRRSVRDFRDGSPDEENRHFALYSDMKWGPHEDSPYDRHLLKDEEDEEDGEKKGGDINRGSSDGAGSIKTPPQAPGGSGGAPGINLIPWLPWLMLDRPQLPSGFGSPSTIAPPPLPTAPPTLVRSTQSQGTHGAPATGQSPFSSSPPPSSPFGPGSTPALSLSAPSTQASSSTDQWLGGDKGGSGPSVGDSAAGRRHRGQGSESGS